MDNVIKYYSGELDGKALYMIIFIADPKLKQLADSYIVGKEKVLEALDRDYCIFSVVDNYDNEFKIYSNIIINSESFSGDRLNTFYIKIKDDYYQIISKNEYHKFNKGIISKVTKEDIFNLLK